MSVSCALSADAAELAVELVTVFKQLMLFCTLRAAADCNGEEQEMKVSQ